MLFDTPIDVTEIADSLHDGLYVTDRARRIIYWNKAAERITGFASEEVLHHCCADNILMHVDAQGECLCTRSCPLAGTMADRVPRQAEVHLHHKEGHRVPVLVRTRAIVNGSGEVVGAVEVFSEQASVESLRQRVAQLEELALIDPLTQVPNRRYLGSELVAQFEMLKRSGIPFGVIFMDLDRFKELNDTHGHEVGDTALRTVARTLAATLRSHDALGRWGGEEFLAVLPNTEEEGLRTLAGRLCRMVRHSRVRTPKGFATVSISGGATLARTDDTPGTLLRRVDALMYASKRAGGDCMTVEEARSRQAQVCP
jgi:diguanylate cyclase (GGDEF)-like protein/PAS domain S-box-containing protein